MPREHIAHAAIRRSDNCIAFGKCHADIIRDSPEGTCKGESKYIQGFLTNLLRFVRRPEALHIALAADQVVEPRECKVFLSEHLWGEEGLCDYREYEGYILRDKA